MGEKRIKIVKKTDIEKRKDEERRAEIAMLEVFVSRYPNKAREFLNRQSKNIIDNEKVFA